MCHRCNTRDRRQRSPRQRHLYCSAWWLYPVSYGIKFRSKLELKQDYVVLPLEGLWWAKNYSAYTSDRRDEWLWTMMIRVPDWINQTIFNACVTKAAINLGNSPATLRLETLHEAQCAQIMHIGPTKTRDPQLPRSTTSSFQIMG